MGDPRSGQKMFYMNLEYLIIKGSKEAIKVYQGFQKDSGAHLRASLWPKMAQFDHKKDNNYNALTYVELFKSMGQY